LSKEIAQTVGGKKFGLLIALLALLAVSSAVASSWRSAHATLPATTVALSGTTNTTPGATVAYTATATFTGAPTPAGVGATYVVDFADNLTFVNVTGTGFGAIAPANCVVAAGTNTATCTAPAAVPWANGTLIFNFTNPVAGGTVAAPSQAATNCITDPGGGTSICTNTATGATVTPAVTSTATTTVVGGQSTVTFNIAAGFTYCADPNGIAPGTARTFTASDQVVTGLVVDSTTPDTQANNVPGTHTVVVHDDTTPGGTVTLYVRPVGTAPPVTTNGAPCVAFTQTLTAANFILPELRHINPVTLLPITDQDVLNNVRGAPTPSAPSRRTRSTARTASTSRSRRRCRWSSRSIASARSRS